MSWNWLRFYVQKPQKGIKGGGGGEFFVQAKGCIPSPFLKRKPGKRCFLKSDEGVLPRTGINWGGGGGTAFSTPHAWRSSLENEHCTFPRVPPVQNLEKDVPDGLSFFRRTEDGLLASFFALTHGRQRYLRGGLAWILVLRCAEDRRALVRFRQGRNKPPCRKGRRRVGKRAAQKSQTGGAATGRSQQRSLHALPLPPPPPWAGRD